MGRPLPGAQGALRARLLEVLQQECEQLDSILSCHEAARRVAGRMGFQDLVAMLDAGCGLDPTTGVFNPMAEGVDTFFRQQLAKLHE